MLTQIIVIEGRWNIVGRTIEHGDGSLTIEDAHVIRVWGTTAGLGELALNGPTEQTVLDPCGTVHVPARAVLLKIETQAALWKGSL